MFELYCKDMLLDKHSEDELIFNKMCKNIHIISETINNDDDDDNDDNDDIITYHIKSTWLKSINVPKLSEKCDIKAYFHHKDITDKVKKIINEC